MSAVVLDMDNAGPSRSREHGNFPSSRPVHHSDANRCYFRYANGVPMYCRTDLAVSGNKYLAVLRRTWLARHRVLEDERLRSKPLREMQAPNKPVKFLRARIITDDFFAAMRTRKRTICRCGNRPPHHHGMQHRSDRDGAGRKLRWDPSREEFVGGLWRTGSVRASGMRGAVVIGQRPWLRKLVGSKNSRGRSVVNFRRPPRRCGFGSYRINCHPSVLPGTGSRCPYHWWFRSA